MFCRYYSKRLNFVNSAQKPFLAAKIPLGIHYLFAISENTELVSPWRDSNISIFTDGSQNVYTSLHQAAAKQFFRCWFFKTTQCRILWFCGEF
jgi:hypothetical protein